MVWCENGALYIPYNSLGLGLNGPNFGRVDLNEILFTI